MKKDELRDSNMYVSIEVVNDTEYTLSLTSSSCSSGGFTQGPPATILPNSNTTIRAQGTGGTWTGVNPSWTYELEGTNVTIEWINDIPFDGNNSGSVNVNDSSGPEISVVTNNQMPRSGDTYVATTTISLVNND